MYKSVKVLWKYAIGVNIAAFVFFFLLANRWFTQGFSMDLIATVVLQFCGIPAAALLVASFHIMKSNWKPAGWPGYTGVFIIIAALLWIAGYLFSFAWRV